MLPIGRRRSRLSRLLSKIRSRSGRAAAVWRPRSRQRPRAKGRPSASERPAWSEPDRWDVAGFRDHWDADQDRRFGKAVEPDANCTAPSVSETAIAPNTVDEICDMAALLPILGQERERSIAPQTHMRSLNRNAFAAGPRKPDSIARREPTVVESVFPLCNEGDTKWVSEEARYFGCWAYRCQSFFSWLCFGTIKGRQR